jgi:hypothetical protein
MKIDSLRIGMSVKHPQYGVGVVKNLSEHTADVSFEEGRRIIDPDGSALEPADAQATVTGLEQPLHVFIRDIVQDTIDAMGIEKPDSVADQLGARWNGGKIVLHPADPTLQTKEVPLEVFFHKIVMMRNNLRTLEMKLNAHEKLTDGEKFDLQQYITRSYGSMTTFNIFFRNKEDQFGA